MTNYLEEQSNEIEALQSIYPDEIEIFEESPHFVFNLKVASQQSEEYDAHAKSAVIRFTFTPNYPDALPEIEFFSSDNIEEKEEDELMEFMKAQGEENLGMVMIFTIISTVQERLTELTEQAAKRQEQEEEKKKRLEEEAERKKFEGTRVTVESFMAWKMKFDAETTEKRRLKGLVDTGNKKPTGKELFLSDQSMNDSDVKFLQAEGDTLEVDESLFENMGDLDLDDDDEDDDPDYVPGDDD